METSTTFIRWAVVVLTNHVSVQERLHAEIDHVIGRERLPTLDDRSQSVDQNSYAQTLLVRFKSNQLSWSIREYWTANPGFCTTESHNISGQYIEIVVIQSSEMVIVICDPPIHMGTPV